MNKINFASGVSIGSKTVGFEKQKLHDRYFMWIPDEFTKDSAILSNYTYWYSREESPLSIAVRYTSVTSAGDRKKMISHYFSRGCEAQPVQATNLVSYRDTLLNSSQMSVYSLRFSVEMSDGVLFGCFNCAGNDMDSWKPVIIAMLGAVTTD